MTLSQTFKDIKRVEHIAKVLVKYKFYSLLSQLHIKEHLPLKKRLGNQKGDPKLNPELLVSLFEELGGAFVKLGQLLSLRPDLIPHEYCEAFSQLQDNVKPESFSDIKKTIEASFGKPLKKVYRIFEERPVASASISQVHKAVLYDGTLVAVKVQRSTIQELFQTDIDILRTLAKRLAKHLKTQLIDPIQIVKEFEDYTRQELDFELEGKNILTFREKCAKDKHIIVPRPYIEFTHPKILTMEFIDGVSIQRVMKKKGYSRKYLVDTTVQHVLKQVFEHGFFHADPHPGNIFVVGKKDICFLDFGIMGRLTEDNKRKLQLLFIGMLLRDMDITARAMKQLGFVSKHQDDSKLKEDLRLTFSKYYGTELGFVHMHELLPKLLDIARVNSIVIPKDMVLLTKTVITVEGLAQQLDPHYNFVQESKSYAINLQKKYFGRKQFFSNFKKDGFRFFSFLSSVPEKTETLVQTMDKTVEQAERIDKDLRVLAVEMDRSSNRVSLAFLIMGCIIAGALLMPFLVSGIPLYSYILFIVGGIFGIIFLWSVLHEKKYPV